jgi:hypothetical protein
VLDKNQNQNTHSSLMLSEAYIPTCW